MSIIPHFNAHSVFIEPWTLYTSNTLLITLMGFLVAAACGIIGNYVILRRMALVGDAISHSLLPGIALAFFLTSSRNTSLLFLGALASALLAVFLIEFIHKNSRLKPDAAIGIVFSTLFAFGVILVTLFADHIDLDTECVLYGEIAFIPLEYPISLAGLSLPFPIVRMAIILIALLLIVSLFYKELLVSTFDPTLALSLGINPRFYHYGITLVLSIIIVSAFKSVGAILVLAMLLFPGATALLISKNLKKIHALTLLQALLYPLLGFHLATWLDCSIAAAMSTSALTLFLLTWLSTLLKKLLPPNPANS